MARARSPKQPETLIEQWGAELRRYREAEGMTQGVLGKSIGYSESAIGMFEAGERVMTLEIAESVDLLLKTGGALRGWLRLILKETMPEWFLTYVGMEARAKLIRIFEPQIVPGLFQTEEYARVLLEAGRLDDITGPLATRMSRQMIFESDTAPHVWVVLEETAVERLIGNRQVMRGQIGRLIEESAKPRNVFQIIPKDVGAHAGLDGNLNILSFEEGPDVGFVDGQAGGLLIAKSADVDRVARNYDLLRAVAMSPAESVKRLRALHEELAT